MLKKIFLLLLSVGLFSNCGNQNSDNISVSNFNNNSDLDIPFELDPEGFQNSEKLLIAKSVDNSNIEFILQKSPSILYSDNSSLQNSFSTILTNSVIEGEYEISPYTGDTIFSLEESDDGKLSIVENGNPVLTYNFGMQLPDGVEERYRRSTYIHPIYDLKGNILSDDFPDDHYHHRGLSWMWPKVFIDSMRYDLWHIYGQQGELEGIHQVFEKWIIKDVGPVCATIGAKNYWQLDGGQKVMDEWIYVKSFRATGDTRAIDIKIVFKANIDISFEGQTKKGYGGLNFRLAPRKETQISSYLGIEDDSDLKKLPWADQSAIFGSNDYFSGISIFQNKSNNKFPAGWCLRHYGFLGVAWPGIERYNMNSGDTLTLSFRLLVHQGNAKEAKVENIYEHFNNSPVIEFKK